MNLKLISIIFICIVFFSACSTNSSASNSGWFGFGSNDLQGGSDVSRNGNGLDVSIDLDDDLLPRIRYDITFRNTGEDMVEVRRENLIFTTEQRNQGSSIFTQESITSLYDKLFEQRDVLQIPPTGEDLVVSGTLFVDPEYYQDLTNQGFTYHMSIEYDYTTKFDNNVQLDLETYEIRTDRPNQGAPVKMRQIEILPTQDDSNFQLVYTIEDTASNFEDTLVRIEDLEIIFGSDYLSCRYFYEENDDFIEVDSPILSNLYSSLLVVCDVNAYSFDENSITTTKTSGSFSYIYTTKESGEIRFSKDSRSLGIN